MRCSAASARIVWHFWTDQAGFRLGQADTIQAGPVYKLGMSYTVAGQLYHSVTPWMHDLGHHDVNWHWYGPDGYRVMTHVRAGEATPYGLSYEVGPRTYYFNDGADVTLTVRRESAAGSYKVFQRYLTGGVDQQLAARINGITTRSVALVADIQGSTIKLLKDDLVTVDCDPSLTVRGPFGAAVTAQAGCGESSETGFAGASTPSSNGGYTYLRNRWYDPQTSRFLTQDPIGLAGGVNLYAYAGGNPVAYSDPFGLCDKTKDPTCSFAQQVLAAAKAKLGKVLNAVVGDLPAARDVVQAQPRGSSRASAVDAVANASVSVDYSVTGYAGPFSGSLGTNGTTMGFSGGLTFGATVDATYAAPGRSGTGPTISFGSLGSVGGVLAGGSLNVNEDFQITGGTVSAGVGFSVPIPKWGEVLQDLANKAGGVVTVTSEPIK